MKLHNLFLRGAGLVLFSVLGWLQSLQAITLTVSPSSVSNGYNGYITLQIGGVPSGAGVVVQKFLDANSNGVVDAGDIMVLQGNDLKDGKVSQVIGGVTNFNVPSDSDGATNGSITAKILFNNGDFIQQTIGQYLFVISSTNGAFTPVTNAFNVTNLPYGQKITGTVTNGAGVPVTNALVILFPPPRAGGDHGPGNPVALALADNSGVYAIAAPPGSYVPLAFRSNYVGNFSAAPMLTLGSAQTLTTNLTLSNATMTVSGSYVDTTNSGKVLAGVFVPLSTSDGLIVGGFTDTNGNFNVPVSAGETWSVGGDSSGLIIHGYLGYQNNPTNVSSGATGVTIGFPRATALFYGTVLDNLGNPIPGIAIEATDQNNGIYQQDGYSDTNGNYVTVALGGLGNNDPWNVQVDQNPTNYVFSQPALQQNGGTNIAVGQAVQVNFTAVPVTGAITGHVQYNGSPVVGVGINANTSTNGVSYQPSTAHTDSNGNYTLYVANANWSVGPNCGGGDDSLHHILGGNYECQYTNVNIANNTGMANFTVQVCSGAQIFTSSLPSGQVNAFYDNFLQGATCNGNLNWSLNDPQDFPGSLNLDNNGEIFGTPDTAGTFNFSVNLSDGNGNSTNQSLSLTINPAIPQLQVTTASLPNGTNGVFYSTTLQASGGLGNYSWGLAPGSASLPANLSLGTNGLISGTPVVSVTNLQFIAQVTYTKSELSNKTLSLTINQGVANLQVTTTSLPNGTNGVFYNQALQASGGYPPYSWALASGSANLPANLELGTNGVISGTPDVAAGSYPFIVRLMDTNGDFQSQQLSLTIVGSPPPVKLSLVPQPGNGTLEFTFTGVSGVNYSLQSSPDLKTWTTVLSFTGSGSAETISAPTTGGKALFYRVKTGP